MVRIAATTSSAGHGRTGTEIALDIEVDILKQPAEMAAETMAQYDAA